MEQKHFHMEALTHSRFPLSTGQRLGFHYFPDTLHYREIDLSTWVPRLQALGAAWLVLQSETGRAIPESFISGMAGAGIEPVVHFKRGIETALDLREIRPLLESYAKWGVRYVITYDRPNARSSWPSRGWVQQDLVKNFLDRYLPAAELTTQLGLVAVFPPLEPGGNYWDTAFLRSALQGMVMRANRQVLKGMALSAYGWTHGHPLNWGAGGPERWPQSKPYHTPENSQDQLGICISDWYQSAAQQVLGRTVPIFLLQAGCPGDPEKHRAAQEQDASVADILRIARLLAGEEDEEEKDLEIPAYVAAGCFWVLSTAENSPYAGHAWYRPALDGSKGPGLYSENKICSMLKEWQARRCTTPENFARMKSVVTNDIGSIQTNQVQQFIDHYLLLPGHEWGVSDWYLEVTRPFIKKYRPTIGFSVDEAMHARQVTVVGNVPGFTREAFDQLKNIGCKVEWIDGDGMTIATQLAER